MAGVPTHTERCGLLRGVCVCAVIAPILMAILMDGMTKHKTHAQTHTLLKGRASVQCGATECV